LGTDHPSYLRLLEAVAMASHPEPPPRRLPRQSGGQQGVSWQAPITRGGMSRPDGSDTGDRWRRPDAGRP
jgi:hypothetical protein